MKSHSEDNHSAAQCVVIETKMQLPANLKWSVSQNCSLDHFILQCNCSFFTVRASLLIKFSCIVFVGFECRCGGLFCAVHRYSDKHDCSFNYREMGAEEIRRNNPVVVGEKIQKIWTPPLSVPFTSSSTSPAVCVVWLMDTLCIRYYTCRWKQKWCCEQKQGPSVCFFFVFSTSSSIFSYRAICAPT